MTKQLVILVVVDSYLPGFRGGGPIRSVANLVDHLGDDVAFRILTRNRDFRDTSRFAEVQSNRWLRVGKAEVLYLDARGERPLNLRATLQATPYDVLYLNSFFSLSFGVVPLALRRLRLLPNRVTVVAPRGEFSSGALALKRIRKRAFLQFARLIGLPRAVVWHATSREERHEILDKFPGADVVIAANIPSPVPDRLVEPSAKTPGSAKLIFLSRIVPKKNLLLALWLLSWLNGDVQLDVYGPIEDLAYWRRCQAAIARLTPDKRVLYRGVVASDDVTRVLSQYHFLVLPTLGENYGHVIFEALAAGCPVVISDRTPWRNLAGQRAGWDLSLARVDCFREILQACVDMDGVVHKRWRQGARELAFSYAAERRRRSGEEHLTLFQRAGGRKR